jgi:hypothetical protein
MNLKLMFALLAVFSLILPIHATATCCNSTGICVCSCASSCTYTCNPSSYNCDENSVNGCESSTPCNQYTFQRYTFNLSAHTPSSIKSITYCFEGYYTATGSGSAKLQYYNVTSNSWVDDQSLDTWPQTVKCTTLTSINDVLNATEIFQFAVRGYTGSSGTVSIYADNVNLSVSYGTGGILSWTNGKFSNALSFDGSGAYASASDFWSLNINGALTAEAWVKPSTVTPAYQTILQKANSTSENYGLYLKGSEVYFEWTGGGSSRSIQTTSANLQPNTWYHVATVFNYSASSVKIYVNGVENASGSASYDLTKNSGSLSLGQNNGLTYPFNGTIDEVAIYSRAKSADEIYADANPVFVSLDIRDSLNNSVMPMSSNSGYINAGANNTMYLKLSNNGNLNMTVGDYAGTYSLRFYITNAKANLLLQTIQQGVSSMQAVLPVQLQIYNQLFSNLIITSK